LILLLGLQDVTATKGCQFEDYFLKREWVQHRILKLFCMEIAWVSGAEPTALFTQASDGDL
jgi:hypothetical protein